jgi:hypothetical protein
VSQATTQSRPPRGDRALRAIGRLATRLLGHRLFPAIGAGIAILVALPTLDDGLLWDDFVLLQALSRSPDLLHALVHTYVFVMPDSVAELKEIGTLPWWALDDMRWAFLRPVSSLTLWIDHRLWPDSPALMHAQSIAWFGLVAFAVGLLYRRLAGVAWAGGLALVFFVLDDSHAYPVAWLALRNGVVSLLFGLMALLFHVRWRGDGSRSAAIAALFCFALSLLSAELGVSTAAYLLAYALCLDDSSPRARAASLLPYVAVVVVWRISWSAMGFGVEGGGYYADPLDQPERFVLGVVSGVPLLLMGQFSWVEVDLYNSMELSARAAWWSLAVLFCVLFALVLLPLLKRERVARFWAAGVILATIPVSISQIPSERLLLFASVGAMGLSAEFVSGLFAARPWVPTRWMWRAPLWGFAVVLLAVNLVLAPYSRSFQDVPIAQRELESLIFVDRYADVADREVIIVNAPSPFQLYYLRPVLEHRGRPLPGKLWVLAPGYASVDVERLNDATVIVRPEDGYLVEPGRGRPIAHIAYYFQTLATALRAPWEAIPVGAQDSPKGIGVRVLETAEGGNPTTVQFRFPRALDDPGYVWLRFDWEHLSYVPFTPPAVGERKSIAGGL